MRRGDYGCGPVVVAGVRPRGPRGALAHTGLSAAQSSERRAGERDGIQRVLTQSRRHHQFDPQCVPSLLVLSDLYLFSDVRLECVCSGACRGGTVYLNHEHAYASRVFVSGILMNTCFFLKKLSVVFHKVLYLFL